MARRKYSQCLSRELRRLSGGQIVAALAISAVVLILGGCAHRGPASSAMPVEQPSGEPSYPLTLADDRQEAVTIDSEPRRIVSLTPSNTEILYALGLGERVVGVTNWCNYPPEAKEKPKVGDANTSIEKVISLQPDLVLAHAVLNDSAIRRFERLKLSVIALDPETMDAVKRSILLIGRACGGKSASEKIGREMESRIGAVSVAAKGRQGLRTLVVIQPNPLWVAGPATFVDEMLSICNSPNVAHDARSGFNLFPIERALARDPEVIVVGKDDERDFFLKSPIWKNTNAVRSGRVVVIDPDLLVRPGPRLVDGLDSLARLTSDR